VLYEFPPAKYSFAGIRVVVVAACELDVSGVRVKLDILLEALVFWSLIRADGLDCDPLRANDGFLLPPNKPKSDGLN
jgi:hypothetical protein